MWHGWTTPANAGKYEAVVREQVIPDIEARRIPGFLHIDLLRYDQEDQVVFVTLMWFDDLSSVRGFMGEDYTRSHVPSAARAVLLRYDEHARHFQVLDRRPQGPVGN
jgi:antibiotic biosynthesis monooxygenase (ABM) superfamily enzyme